MYRPKTDYWLLPKVNNSNLKIVKRFILIFQVLISILEIEFPILEFNDIKIILKKFSKLY